MTVKQAIIAMMAALLWALPGLRAQDTEAEELWDYTIPEGTEFKLQLHTTVATKTSKEGDRVLATLLDPVIVEDAEVCLADCASMVTLARCPLPGEKGAPAG